jgi:hypothetical protein
MNKLYIITYKTNSAFNAVAFHNYIEDLYKKKWITDWWHYIDSAYIVASNQTAEALYNAAAPGMKGIQYVLIIEVDPKNEQGWLPPKAWEWLQKYK